MNWLIDMLQFINEILSNLQQSNTAYKKVTLGAHLTFTKPFSERKIVKAILKMRITIIFS